MLSFQQEGAMSKQEWLTACIAAVFVAALTVMVTVPPMCWAEGKTLVAVPALPSTGLTIPSIDAQISASATPVPGLPVKVLLALSSPPGTDLAMVPVTMTVQKTTMNPMARSMPAPDQLTQIETYIPVGSDGKGVAVVELPLVWAQPAPKPAAEPAKDGKPQQLQLMPTVTNYWMVLSSSLGGKSAPAEVQTFNQAIETQAVGQAPAVQITPWQPLPAGKQLGDDMQGVDLLSWLDPGQFTRTETVAIFPANRRDITAVLADARVGRVAVR